MSRRSEEARRQREKEERSRRKIQEQAYRETQRSVYARIYQEQNEMPDDYEAAFQEKTGSAPPSGKKRRRRTVLIVLLLMFLALVGAALAAHAVLVHRPELPQEEEVAEETNEQPRDMGAGRREDVYTFLLIGRDDKGGGNTDTIMVGCFDAKNETLDMLSIYRDTLVDVPWEIKKINSVYNMQGLEGLQGQIRNLIGYQPDYYFVVEMSALEELVDAIGGVDFDVPYSMSYDDPTQNLHIHLDKGMQHLDGKNSVHLLRWRKNNSGESLSVGDIGRVEIQHSFLKAMADQAIRLGNITKVRQIAAIVDKNLTSDLTYGEMLWFGEKMLGMKKDNIHFYGMPGDYTGTIWSPTYQNYQSYVFVNPTALLDLVNEHLNPYLRDITSEEQHVIHGTMVNTQPTLPPSTGLPIIQTPASDDQAELPTGQPQPATPPPADPTQPSEPETAPQQETPASESQPAAPDNQPAQPQPEPEQESPSEPEPAPQPEPQPEPQPAPEPQPESEPAPQPEPQPAPAPAPQPEPQASAQSESVSAAAQEPAPAPQPAPAAAPGETSEP